MNKEIYSGALAERLIKCSKAVFSTFWKLLSLLKAAPFILQHAKPLQIEHVICCNYHTGDNTHSRSRVSDLSSAADANAKPLISINL